MTTKKPRSSKNTAAATVTRTSAFAALGCAVILSTPPKSAGPDGYWGVRVATPEGVRYSPTYRMKTAEAAQALAEKIAADRGIPVKTVAAPERPVIHPPQPQQREPLIPYDGSDEQTPF